MILNKNSFSTKLYMWFYDIDDYDLPKNLCGYFWNYTFLLFILLITWPIVLLSYPVRKDADTYISRLGIGIGLFIGLGILSSICSYISYVFFGFLDIKNKFVQIGGIFLFSFLVVLTIIGVQRLTKVIQKKKPNKKKQFVVVEYWKAFKGKYCPKINWNE